MRSRVVLAVAVLAAVVLAVWGCVMTAGALALRPAAGGPPPVPADTLPARLVLDRRPVGLRDPFAVPPDNPLTEAKAQLGRKLFFDPRLSQDNTVACASCHDPAHGFASPEPKAVGIRGLRGSRNAPSLFNRAYAGSLFWDGRSRSLEEQALKPIEDPNEMGAKVPDILDKLRADPKYPALFQEAFGEGISAATLAKALASFQRTLLLGDSKVDAFIDGRVAHLNPSAKHGLWLFESRGGCWRCHSGPNFADEQFHNTGVSWGVEPLDLGRFALTGQEADKGKFKTPTLRGVARTAPYMHDGSIQTLEAVIAYYNRGGNKNPHLDPAITPLRLTKDEEHDLVEFLKALSESPEDDAKAEK